MKHLLLTVIAVAMGFSAFAGDFPLVKDGKAANIVIGEYFDQACGRTQTTFSGTEAYAATELADYVHKITGVRPGISSKADSSRPNIYLMSWFSGARPPESKKLVPQVGKIKDDGFLIYAQDDVAYIIGKRPRGVLYGAYEILKKYGDIRWILPGEKGEYYGQKKEILIPEQANVTNPSLKYRRFNLVCANVGSTKETPIWMLRNNMQPHIFDCDQGAGGHIFSTLLPDTLFPQNPELFGLYDGKRMPQSGKILPDPSQYRRGGQANQPCTSNPETRRIMAENLIKIIGERRADNFTILNNDSTKWCECENCRKLDPPGEKKRGLVSTRFWDLANFLIEKGQEAYPNVQFVTSAYQTFQQPPEGLMPDKRALVDVCVHHRCYTHSIGDEKCDLNRRYRKIIAAWQKLGMPFLTYEYTNCLPRKEVIYLPLEGVNTRDLKYYHKIGSSGYCDETPPHDGIYGKRWAEDRVITESWEANFLVRYMQAYFMWNAEADFDEVLDDVGSRYYGKTWPAIKEYRANLRAAYEKVDSHFLYGTPPMALGKCVADEAVLKQLNASLDKALEMAKGDKQLTEKVGKERAYFQDSFVKMREEYLAQQVAPAVANKTSGEIMIDGEFNEKDWQNAMVTDDFRIFLGQGAKAVNHTRVRVLYDDAFIYFAVEVLDNDMKTVTMDCTQNDSGEIWKDSNLEFFFSSPAFGYQYLHWVVNARGAAWDAMTYTPLDSNLEFNANATVKTKVKEDRWQVEVGMPLKALGGVVPKKGDLWRVNIARHRNKHGEVKGEGSSWSNGAFHGLDGYRQILFQ